MSAALKIISTLDAFPELSEKPRLGKIFVGEVRDWEKPAVNDCELREKSGISVRPVSGQTLYAYVLGNPINLIDPSGLVGLDRTGAYAYLKDVFRRDVEAAISDIPSVSATASATVGSTTMTRSTAYSGTNWGQTTQLSVGMSLGVCINEPKPAPNSCSSNRDIKPDNFSLGVGKNLGVTVGTSGSACLNFGPSFGLPGGVGWDL